MEMKSHIPVIGQFPFHIQVNRAVLQNFFLECGARTHKMRVYQMTDNPVAREMIGYLLVRGGVHVVAYAKALEIATGVDITKLVPIPSLENKAFETTRKFEAEGVHRKLYTFSATDYKDVAMIWKGNHPGDGGKLEVIQGTPPGGPMPDLENVPEEFAPSLMRILWKLQRGCSVQQEYRQWIACRTFFSASFLSF